MVFISGGITKNIFGTKYMIFFFIKGQNGHLKYGPSRFRGGGCTYIYIWNKIKAQNPGTVKKKIANSDGWTDGHTYMMGWNFSSWWSHQKSLISNVCTNFYYLKEKKEEKNYFTTILINSEFHWEVGRSSHYMCLLPNHRLFPKPLLKHDLVKVFPN